MIDFKPLEPSFKDRYNGMLRCSGERGCEFSFANLYLWGRQKLAFLHGHALLFSQFNRRTVYPFPVGCGDKKPVIDAIIADAAERGIPCRITGLTAQNMALLQELYPDKFRYHCDCSSFDYVYDINDLADLAGRKYQKKRNHFNRFRTIFPYYTTEPLSNENLPQVQALIDHWYAQRMQEDPQGDYHMERSALNKALTYYRELGMEALVLRDGEDVLAFTMASPLNTDTLDVHFEKALDVADGAYAAINQGFARYLMEQYPRVKFLNREDDMGIEGLRKAKLSYNPEVLLEKHWARLWEDEDEN